MQIWAESGKSALPICNYSQILYQFLTFTQNLKRSQNFRFFTRPFSFMILQVRFLWCTAVHLQKMYRYNQNQSFLC